jgi:hypothetical protein
VPDLVSDAIVVVVAVDPLDGYYDNDSVGYKIRHVLGGAVMEPRAAAASNGSAS